MAGVNVFCLFIVLCLIKSNVAFEGSASSFGYHAKVGIPLALELRAHENQMSRIIGGTPTQIGAIPYHAGLVITLTSGWQSVCGGSLVSVTKVLSAAHCWWDGDNQGRQITVVLGSVTLFSGGTRIVTTNVRNHDNWNPSDVTFDISIITIERVTISNNINILALPSLTDVNQQFVGMTGVTVGYGKTSDVQSAVPSDTSLRHVSVPIISNSDCQRDFDITIHGSVLCTSGSGRVGTCSGDSGGPLTVIWNSQAVLVGITSFGPETSCEGGFPSVFSRVTAFLTWIQANL